MSSFLFWRWFIALLLSLYCLRLKLLTELITQLGVTIKVRKVPTFFLLPRCPETASGPQSIPSEYPACISPQEMLDIFRRYVEDDVVKTTNMASDGTVHQLTSTVMSFSETLLQYEETVGNMILGTEHDPMF